MEVSAAGIISALFGLSARLRRLLPPPFSSPSLHFRLNLLGGVTHKPEKSQVLFGRGCLRPKSGVPICLIAHVG